MMRPVVIFFLLGASVAFGIDGTVRNGTTDHAQANAALSLFRISQNGPELVASGKSGADGSFHLSPPQANDAPGPRLLQAVYDGVTYNKMILPGAPTKDVQIDVFQASTQPGAAKVATHMMILEPAGGQLAVSESFVYTNGSKITYNNTDAGAVQFYLPSAANGKVEVSVLAPNSVSVRGSARETGKPNIYKVNFPVKPGESRIDLSYQMPFTSPGTFVSKALIKDPNTKVLAPPGVTLTAPGIQNLGQEPRTQATVYGIDGSDLRIEVQGTGALARNNGDAQQADQNADQGGGSISELMPQLYSKTNPADGLYAAAGAVKWVLLLAFGMLALGFTYLYRKPDRKPGLNERKL